MNILAVAAIFGVPSIGNFPLALPAYLFTLLLSNTGLKSTYITLFLLITTALMVVLSLSGFLVRSSFMAITSILVSTSPLLLFGMVNIN